MSLLLSGCSNPQSEYVYTEPEAINDRLEVASIHQVGISQDPLGKAIDQVREGKYGEVHSILIYKDGQLAVEEYFSGHIYDWDGPNFHGAWVAWDQTRRHNVHSVGKSITSACVGIAVEEGYISSVEDSIFDYLSDYQDLSSGGKDQITIEHLLTMTSGLEWDEWGSSYASGENDVIKLWIDCEDPIACILEKPLVHQPGSTFNYSGGDMVLLGEIIKNASGMDIEAFSWQYLFQPLGVDTPPWSWIDQNVIYAGGDQMLTPREMLKFGILFLNDGLWEGQQILPAGWVVSSSVPYGENTGIRVPGEGGGSKGYGYTWWIDELRIKGEKIPIFYALGFGDQRIFVIPELEAVVVFTSGNYVSADPSFGILRDYFIPAMVD